MNKETTTVTSTPPAPPEMRIVEEETAKIMAPDELPFEKEPEIIAEKHETMDMEEENLTMPIISKTFPEMDIAKEEKQEETNAGREIGIGGEDVREIVTAQIETVLSERLGSAGDESPLRSKDVEELKDEIAGSKVRFDEIVDNIEALSNAVTTAHDSIQTMKNNSDEFDSEREKIVLIENRLGGLEEVLKTIQSDNTDLKNGLSNIEQNVSELLNSYSVLFTQINESAASNESRMSEFSKKVNRIDTIESTVQDLEKSLATTGETIVELGNTMSALMNNVAEAYAANKSLSNDSKTEFQKIHEEMNSFTKHVEKEIKKIGAEGYRSLGQSIQLTLIQKNSATMKVCMEWLEFLMELVGCNNLPDILAYYEELEWITDDVRLELLRYAEGIDYYLEKPDWKLNPDDHVKSIWFIEKLAGVKVDKNRLSIIDRDIEKVKRGIEVRGI
jgi:archaellum component FlaD/FlaE